jgi:hypothetical protein
MMAGSPAAARLATAIRAGRGRFPVFAGAHAASAPNDAKTTLTGAPSPSRASITLISTCSSSFTADARAAFASSPCSGGTGSSSVPLMSVR